jgi:hypothetical protein
VGSILDSGRHRRDRSGDVILTGPGSRTSLSSRLWVQNGGERVVGVGGGLPYTRGGTRRHDLELPASAASSAVNPAATQRLARAYADKSVATGGARVLSSTPWACARNRAFSDLRHHAMGNGPRPRLGNADAGLPGP